MNGNGGKYAEPDMYARLSDAQVDRILAGGARPEREYSPMALAASQHSAASQAQRKRWRCSQCGRPGHYRNKCGGTA